MFASADLEAVLVRLAGGVLVAGSIGCWSQRAAPERFRLAASGSMAAVAALLALAIGIRWMREEQGPFLTLYDVLLSNVFSLSAIFLFILGSQAAIRAAALVVLPFLSVLGLWLATSNAAAVPLPATFDNPWLWLHVLSGKIFFGLSMTAAAGALLLQAGNRFVVSGSAMAAPEDTESTVWQLASLAFVFHGFMIIAGSVWAHSAWGRYWSWDPLETWTLVNWLTLGLLLHGRITYRQVPAGWWRAGLMVVFALAFLTFLGVPFISVAPHKGVM